MIIQITGYLLNTDNIYNITGIKHYGTNSEFVIQCFNGINFRIISNVVDIWSSETGGEIENIQGFWPKDFSDPVVKNKYLDMVVPLSIKRRDELIDYWKGAQSIIPKID